MPLDREIGGCRVRSVNLEFQARTLDSCPLGELDIVEAHADVLILAAAANQLQRAGQRHGAGTDAFLGIIAAGADLRHDLAAGAGRRNRARIVRNNQGGDRRAETAAVVGIVGIKAPCAGQSSLSFEGECCGVAVTPTGLVDDFLQNGGEITLSRIENVLAANRAERREPVQVAAPAPAAATQPTAGAAPPETANV